MSLLRLRSLPWMTAVASSLLMLVVSFALAPGSAAQISRPPWHSPGMWCWDNWFVYAEGQWHAFYLQLPQAVGLERRWKNNDFYKHVGHAVSRDLVHWEDRGPALAALSGTWLDKHIATGSIVQRDGKWWMLFTGRGTQGDGVGLAESADLETWRFDERGPVLPLTGTWGTGEGASTFSSTWHGRPVRWIGISDPYVPPEPVNGWYYLVLCSRVLEAPLATSGCLTVVRSRDLRQWEDPQIVAWPQCFERMETPQLWRRQSQWYLSFGGVLNREWLAQQNPAALPKAVRGQPTHRNYVYRMASMLGPAEEAGLQFLATPRDHYIMKVLNLPSGEDVALFTAKAEQQTGISPAYPVEYGPDGTLKLKP